MDNISRRENIRKKTNFKNISCCLKKPGFLQNQFKSVHIAGTNGKGTVAHLITNICINAGYKTGLFTSPHLIDIRERITIDNKKLSKSEFISCFEKVQKTQKGELTFFETLTAMAFLAFTEKKVDIAVIETGIGGKMDVTNIIKPVLTIITSVDLDHTRMLGKSLKSVACQKAGIIKPEIPCITGYMKSDAFKEIKKTAKKLSAPVIQVKKNSIFKHLKTYWDKNLTIVKETDSQKLWEIALIGAHQITNAEIGFRASKELNKCGFDISAEKIKKSFETVKLPARFQILKPKKTEKNANVIIDGCHNPASVENFKNIYLSSPFAETNSCLVFDIMRDKDYKKVIKMLSGCFENVIIFNTDKNRSLNGGKSACYFKKFNPKCNIVDAKSFSEAFRSALKHETAIFAGSFYLAGKAISACRDKHYQNTFL